MVKGRERTEAESKRKARTQGEEARDRRNRKTEITQSCAQKGERSPGGGIGRRGATGLEGQRGLRERGGLEHMEAALLLEFKCIYLPCCLLG